MARKRVVILGAGGRDFHVFNTLYRDDPSVCVVAFTAAQIPHIDDRRDVLLCRYRLFPLAQDQSLLDDLPTELTDGTAEEYALLAGLWGYRAGTASVVGAMRDGIRSARLLDEAVARDADHPLVLLIEGQSLLFKPKIAGGSAEEALVRFERLFEIVRRTPGGPVSALEAELWVWYALDQLGHQREADALRERLLATDPPPLFREFLLSPP